MADRARTGRGGIGRGGDIPPGADHGRTDRAGRDLRAILTVAAIAVGAGALISTSHEISADRIQRNAAARTLRSLHEVLDPSRYDNDLVRSRIEVAASDLLGTSEPAPVFLATRDGRPAAAIFAVVAPRGYGGPIDLLVAVDTAGTVQGVRVTAHRETPGLGNPIDISISDWITGFDGASLSDPSLPQWGVTVDGGRFDALTGATITPRAVVQAVRDALIYFDTHRDELFARLPEPAAAPNAVPTTAPEEPEPTFSPNPAAAPDPEPAAARAPERSPAPATAPRGGPLP